jgi:uncharacterized membrane protein
MTDADLERKLEQLAARLDRVERFIQIKPAGGTAGPPTRPTAPPAAARPTPPPRPVSARPQPQRKKRPPLEIRIGQNLSAWVGAIAIVVAAAFLVKLGYESGWWTLMQPVTRCLLVAVFGLLLLAAGEVALRRIGVAASFGLFGAGLGTLYLDAFAAFTHLGIVSLEWSFVLMAAVAVLGFGVTLRTRFVAIGTLSVIGGFLTPWLLSSGWTHTVQVGTYLTMLLGVSLALSMAGAQRFRVLRYVALGGTGATGLGLVLTAIGGRWTAGLVFAAIWWAIVVVEATVAAIRGQSRNGNVIATLLATAWFVTVGCWVLHETQPAGSLLLGWFALAVAGAAVAVALQFGPAVSALAGRPKAAIDRLAVALWAQGGVLLAVAVALMFDGFGQSIGWLAIGLGSIEIGRRLRLRAVDIFGLIVGALAVARVALLDWNLGALDGTVLAAGQVHLTAWSILAFVAIVATHVAARRLGPAWRAGPVVLAVLATLGWVVLCQLETHGMTAVAAWLFAAAGLIALESVGRRQRYFEIAVFVLWCSAVRWLYEAAVLRVEVAGSVTGQVPVFNWQMAVVAAIAAVGWWSSRVLAGRFRSVGRAAAGDTTGWQLAMIGVAVLMLVGFSFELDRVVEILRVGGRSLSLSFGLLRQLLFTMLWATGAVGIGLVARAMPSDRDAVSGARGPRLLVGFAWVLMTACVAKWLLVDTLYWTLLEDAGMTAAAWPLLNLQMVSALIVAASSVAVCRLTVSPSAAATDESGSGNWIRPAAVMLLLWGLSFEVDRLIGRYEASRPAGWLGAWDPLQLRALWWTLLWAVGGLAMIAWSRRRFTPSMMQTGWYLLAGAAVVWLGFDTVAWRLYGGVAPTAVVFNVQFLVGATTGLMIAAATIMLRRMPITMTTAVGCGFALIGLIGLWLGSLEIDRFAGQLAQDSVMARQMGWSIYWGLYAIGLVLLGFAKRWAVCRYAGLALFALTVGKVVTVDMADVRYIYRVISFLVLGLLLVGTSIGYAKLSPGRISQQQ